MEEVRTSLALIAAKTVWEAWGCALHIVGEEAVLQLKSQGMGVARTVHWPQ